MAIAIEAVEIMPNPVTVGEQVKISVTIVIHQYLGKSTHRQLETYTHQGLEVRGETKQRRQL